MKCDQVRGNFTFLYPCLHVGADNNILFVGLTGRLSPAIDHLTKLRVLSHGFNKFFGKLPLEMGEWDRVLELFQSPMSLKISR